MLWAQFVLAMAAAYVGIGALVAIGFVTVGLGRAMPHAGSVTPGARILILPGAVLLWPWVLDRWARPR